MRKFIQIVEAMLAELSMNDFGGGDEPDGREMVEVSGICWYDNDDSEENYHEDLPREATLAIDMERDAPQGSVEMAIMQELNYKYGDRHNAYSLFSEYRFI